MSVQIYYGIDGGAPILSGSVGSLRDILVACLVDGYGTKPGAGWTLEYTAANVASLKQGKLADNKYLYIDDNLSSTPNHARIRGYSSMTSISEGTGLFPDTAQSALGIHIYKSSAQDSSMRNWTLLANESSFYLQINPTNTFNSTSSLIFAFGEFESFKADDTNNNLIVGPISSTGIELNKFGLVCDIETSLEGHYLERSYTTLSASPAFGKHWDDRKEGCTFPNPVDGSILLSPIWITEFGVLRGKFKGIHRVLHNADNFNHGDTFAGTGAYLGKEFQIMRCQSGLCFAFEVSDTW